MKHEVKVITLEDNLEELVGHINAAQWDEDNETQPYAADALRTYLEVKDTIFLVCYLHKKESRVFAGMASCRLEHKPYEFEKWLYIDEIDTCSNLRKKGVGTAMMNKLMEIAKEKGCEEVWLGTEAENDDANSFYVSLDPDAVDPVVGYTWELDD